MPPPRPHWLHVEKFRLQVLVAAGLSTNDWPTSTLGWLGDQKTSFVSVLDRTYVQMGEYNVPSQT